MDGICAIPDCGKPIKARGWCGMHYKRWLRRGDPHVVLPGDHSGPRRRTPVEKRFWSKVRKTTSTGCWEWICALRHGYGAFFYGRDESGKKIVRPAHRVSYELLVGPIPEGLEIDHLCRNTKCVNPAHLEPVTPKVNTLRGESPPAKHARKTHCKRGHAFTPENTRYQDKESEWGRICRACNRERLRNRKAKQAS